MAGENGFDSSRAELFEALGHPTRVKVLRSLQREALGFSELKKEVGIESSGHLQFHLNKLGNLVGTDSNGSYVLTDEGKEALRVLSMARVGEVEPTHWRRPTLGQGVWPKVALTVLLIFIVVTAGFIAYQQEEIASLNGVVSNDTTLVGGSRYYYEGVPAIGINGTSVTFHGVSFTYLEVASPDSCYSNSANYTFACSVRLSNGTVLDLVGKTVEIAISGYFFMVNQTTQGSSGPGYGKVQPGEAVLVTYPDGVHEVFNGFNVTATGYGGKAPVFMLTYSFNAPPANPWFGTHEKPKAGIYWDYSTGSLILYVSVAA